MQEFNGVEIKDGEVKLMQTADCGTSLLLVQEMAHMRQEIKNVLDVSFSYDSAGTDQHGAATVKPVYTPHILSKTVSGHHMRVADDALKQLLSELVCVGQTQIAVDKFYTASPGQEVTLHFEAGVSRLRIKPLAVVATSSGTALTIHDVKLRLEYDRGGREISECEQAYLRWLENTIPEQAKCRTHPFFLLKQVIIAQQLVEFVVKQAATFDFPFTAPIFSDPCRELIFKVEERRAKIWEAVEPGVGGAALVSFENECNGQNIAVFIKKTLSTLR